MNDIEQFILKWNTMHPYDFFFRKKTGIIFNSEEHRSLTFLSIISSLCEDDIIQDFINAQKKINPYLDEDRITEDGKVIVDSTEEEIDDMFDNLNIDELDDNGIINLK